MRIAKQKLEARNKVLEGKVKDLSADLKSELERSIELDELGKRRDADLRVGFFVSLAAGLPSWTLFGKRREADLRVDFFLGRGIGFFNQIVRRRSDEDESSSASGKIMWQKIAHSCGRLS